MKALQHAENGVRVRRRKHRKRKKAALLLLSLAFLTLFAGMVFRYTEIARLGREVAELDQKIEQLTAERDSLQLAMRPHTKRSYIEQIAKNELQMEYNSQEVLIAAAEETSVGLPAGTEPNSTLFGQLSVFVFSLLYR